MEAVVVLAMHGLPPRDFPRAEMAEMFSLHGRIDQAPEPHRESLMRRHVELEARMREWPRTPENDPFYGASYDLAASLSKALGLNVLVGFNEFCAPSLDDALDQAGAQAPQKVIVITPMMTRGGEHSEIDIPAAIERARARHPHLLIEYVWPFDNAEVAAFLADQVRKFTARRPGVLPRPTGAKQSHHGS